MQRVSIVITLFLFVVASAPWLVSSCAPQPLLPLQLSEERAQYETRVAVAQQATLAAQRAATSLPPKVVPIGTLSPDLATAVSTATINVPPAPLTATVPLTATTGMTTSNPITSTSQVTPSVPLSAEILGLATAVMPTATGGNSSARILSSATVTQTGTPVSAVVVARATTSPDPSQAATVQAVTGMPVSATVSTTATAQTAITPTPPINTRGMTAVEDIITEEMLREQVQNGDTDGSFSDIVVRITPDGLRVTGNAVVMLLQRRFTMTGTFVIENESLIVNVDSIRLNGLDVTSQYRVQLESEIRSQLYQLLPQRFVQSFTLEDGQIVVQSLKR